MPEEENNSIHDLIQATDENTAETNSILEHSLQQQAKNGQVLEQQLETQDKTFDQLKKNTKEVVDAIAKSAVKTLGLEVQINDADVVYYKGEKGDKGDLYPRDELINIIKPLIPEPKNGIDGKTPTKTELVSLIKPLIPEPKEGKPGAQGKKGDTYTLTEKDKKEIAKGITVPVVEKIIEKTEVIKEVAVKDTGEEIKKKLEALKTGLSYESLSDLPDISKMVQVYSKQASKTVSLTELDDVDYSGLSIVDGKYVLGSGGGGGAVTSVNGQVGVVVLTTANIADSADKRYVTDAQLVVIGNTSGVNTGDQTSIVGITGTKAQFDTACTDGNFLYVGDVTQYTDEMAQDAVGGMVANSTFVSLAYVDGAPSLTASLSATGTPSSSTYLRGDNTWATIAAGGSPGGSDTQIQYNNAGAFGGSAATITSGGTIDIPAGQKLTNGGSDLAFQTAGSNFHFGGSGNLTMSGASNTSVGLNAFTSNTTGFSNIAIGRGAMNSSSTADNNTIVGMEALNQNTAGDSNTALGQRSLYAVTGSNNLGLGRFAGRYATGSDEFYLDTYDRSTNGGEQANGLMYGVFNATNTSQSLRINGKMSILASASSSTAFLFPASTTAYSSLRITSGTAPTSPLAGDVWYDGTNLLYRSTTSQTLTTNTNTLTITNKRNQPRIVSAASYTTDTGTSLDVSTCDIFVITAQAGALLFNSPGGTPVQGEKLMIRIKDDGTARALTWNAIFRASSDLALPSTTVISKTLYIGFIYNSTDTKWDLLSVLNNI